MTKKQEKLLFDTLYSIANALHVIEASTIGELKMRKEWNGDQRADRWVRLIEELKEQL